MNKKFLPILVISFLILLPIISAASSLSNPVEILGKLFGPDGYIVEWFGGDVVANGRALLAYLRIALFITLFTILFETLIHLNLFKDRRNSAIVISLSISALASFFVGTNLYIIFLTTYNTILWFALLAVPIGAVIALNLFIIPNTNRYFIALKILLFILLSYLLGMISDYSSNIFLIPSGSGSVPGTVFSLTLPLFKPNKKINLKSFLIPSSSLFLIPAVLAQEGVSELIPAFASWLQVGLWLGILYYLVLFLQGKTGEKESKKSSGEGKGFLASIGDFKKKLESLSGESKKESSDLSSALRVDAEDIERIDSLEGVTSKLGDSKLKDEDREVLLAKMNSIIGDLSKPSVELIDKLSPLFPLFERLNESINNISANEKGLIKKAKKAKARDQQAIGNAFLVVKREGNIAKNILNKIESFKVILKQFDDKFSGSLGNYQRALRDGKTKVAVYYLSEMKRIKGDAESYIEGILRLEVDIQNSIHNLQNAYINLVNLLPKK